MKEKNECLETARLDENYDQVHTYVFYHRKSIFVDHTFKRERLENKSNMINTGTGNNLEIRINSVDVINSSNIIIYNLSQSHHLLKNI